LVKALAREEPLMANREVNMRVVEASSPEDLIEALQKDAAEISDMHPIVFLFEEEDERDDFIQRVFGALGASIVGKHQ
jgi:hypothetical protein